MSMNSNRSNDDDKTTTHVAHATVGMHVHVQNGVLTDLRPIRVDHDLF